ncbi:unnamed protein product [Eretmochelys imbricata]
MATRCEKRLLASMRCSKRPPKRDSLLMRRNSKPDKAGLTVLGTASTSNMQTTGEAASANEEAAKAYPEQLKKITEEKGYLPEQVFNADETGLFWKKMPNRTYTSKSERQAPGFKAAKDRVTVLFCGNAAGHLIKPGLLYRAANPRALKGRNKNLLPVFWQ